ncbi:MAG TPA: hypothetical protein VGE55_13225 [Limnobacter sp.]|uniref:hypothetical protein n=1 Tax=Limnobacter sp. TaxID=2003368 RepID=UPI002ED7ACF8
MNDQDLALLYDYQKALQSNDPQKIFDAASKLLARAESESSSGDHRAEKSGRTLAAMALPSVTVNLLKSMGFSDKQIDQMKDMNGADLKALMNYIKAKKTGDPAAIAKAQQDLENQATKATKEGRSGLQQLVDDAKTTAKKKAAHGGGGGGGGGGGLDLGGIENLDFSQIDKALDAMTALADSIGDGATLGDVMNTQALMAKQSALASATIGLFKDAIDQAKGAAQKT